MLKYLMIFVITDIYLSKGFLNPFVKGRIPRRYNRRSDDIKKLDPTFNESFFPSLDKSIDLSIQAKLYGEQYEQYSVKYPWIARIAPSEKDEEATICTAACIRPRVFFSTARCIVGLSVSVFGVVFQEYFYRSKAAVFPDREHQSKQYFDDLGFVVVFDEPLFPISWVPVALFDETNRTDDTFLWFDKLGYEDQEIQHKLLAFNFDIEVEEDYAVPSKLYQQDVIVGIRFCQNIFTRNGLIEGYFVPCVFVCTEAEFNENKRDNDKCAVQIRNNGAMIINTKTNKLLGSTTWSASDQDQESFRLPVGFAIPNSKNFFADLECAEKISKVENEQNVHGFFQKICEPSKKLLLRKKHSRRTRRRMSNVNESYSDSIDLSSF